MANDAGNQNVEIASTKNSNILNVIYTLATGTMDKLLSNDSDKLFGEREDIASTLSTIPTIVSDAIKDRMQNSNY